MPGRVPPLQTTELLFVTDTDLRHSIRQDMGAINTAVTHAEWKAGTVLPGAAIEALLLWRLNVSPPTDADIRTAITSVLTKAVLKDKPPSDREKWSLSRFIEVAGELTIIKEKTVLAPAFATTIGTLFIRAELGGSEKNATEGQRFWLLPPLSMLWATSHESVM
jgi:hypothetical protein